MHESLTALAPSHAEALRTRDAALAGVARLRSVADVLLHALSSAPDRAMAVSVPFLKLCGLTIGGWLMARSAVIAAQRLTDGSDREFHEGKIASAFFYAMQVLPQTLALEQIVAQGGDSVVGTDAALI
jgi:3-(methylthio)propanoyl-CoA dehydrogenase